MRKPRKRYLAIYVEGAKPRGIKELEELVFSSILRLFGELGASKAPFRVVDYDEGEGVAIVMCGHEHLSLVRTAITAITNLRGSPTALHIVDVSGTLRALRRCLPTRLASLKLIKRDAPLEAGVK